MPSRGSWVVVVAVVVAACSDSATRDLATTQKPPRHVFLLTVDTLRADHTSAYGYPRPTTPFLEELAREGVTFEHAIVQWPKTGASFASIFTGRYPRSTGLTHRAALRLPDSYQTLAELFQSQGFTTLAVVSNAVLAARLGWSQGFDEYVETWVTGHDEAFPEDPYEYRRWMNAPRVNELALPLLERYRDAQRLFVWLHYSDPHAPYVLPTGKENPFLGDEHFSGEATVASRHLRNRALDGRRDLKYYVAQYDANVRVADQHIAHLVERARELGLGDDALLIYTADHGESLGEHGSYFVHGPLPYNTTARVPLVFSWPETREAGSRVRQAVALVDLYPTLRQWLGATGDEPGLEGHSLLPVLAGETNGRGGYVFSEAGRAGKETTHFSSVQSSLWKLVFHPPQGGSRRNGQDSPRIELYRLDTDPLEETNLVHQEPAQLAVLRRELRAQLETARPKAQPGATTEGADREGEDELDRRALRALGYIQ